MKLPLALRFIGLEPSEAVESAVHARIRHLERLCPDVTGWRVTVLQERKRLNRARPFAVRVEATMPLRDLAFIRMHDEDVYVALHDAFDAARRNMENLAPLRRRGVDPHDA